MSDSTTTKVFSWVVGILGVVAVIASFYYRGVARESGLRADSLSASNDTLHLTVQESIAVYTRRAIQAEIKNDDLMKQLALKPAVVIKPVFHFDTVKVVDTVTQTVDAQGTPSAHWDIRQEPLTATIDVRMPRPLSEPAILQFHSTLDSLPLGVRIGCGTRGTGGVRPATAVVTAPSWAKLRMGIPQADPDVCNSVASFKVGLPGWTAPASGLVGFLLCVFICR